MMSEGYVYIMTNPSLQDDYLKIGRTEEDPQARAEQLSTTTAVAGPYRVVFSEVVPDCEEAERRVHEKLDDVRVNEGREFFHLSVEEAESVVSSVAEQVRSESRVCRNCEVRRRRDELEDESTVLRRELEDRNEEVADLEDRLSDLSETLSRNRWQAAGVVARRLAYFIGLLVSRPFVHTERFLSRFITGDTERILCTLGVLLLGGLGGLILFIAFAPPGAGIALTLMLLSIAALQVITDQQQSDSQPED
jgi:polyhydroxyalkanoate synthesis regulator phasin